MAAPPAPTPQTPAQQKNALQTMLNKGGKAYDPDAVYCESTGGNGLYEQARIKLPPDTYNLMGIVTGDRQEFRTIQDFIRNAIHHTLHRYIDGDPSIGYDIKDILEMEDWNAELEIQRRRTAAEEEMFEGFRISMNQAVDDHDWPVLQHLWSRADEMAERDDYSDGRRERWAKMADSLQAAMVSMKKEKTRYEKMADITPITQRRAQ